MLIDAHCHLPKGVQAIEQTLERARLAGVQGVVAVVVEWSEMDPILTLARQRKDMAVSLGIHPHEARTWAPEDAARLEKLLAAPEVRFVGETGLDWHYDWSPREAQEAAFRAQIQLAQRVNKPIMIHTRAAGTEVLRMLQESGIPAKGGMIHCFSEDRAFADMALEMGFYLSFSGLVTFPKAAAVADIAAWAPADRILVETDSPYLAPIPFRGKTNEPAHVVHVARCVAERRGMSFAALAEQTTRNLEALCGWAPSC